MDDTYTVTIVGLYDAYAKIGSNGDTITFFINGEQADQTETRTGGETFDNFDLTVTITTTTTTPSTGGGRRYRPPTTTTIPSIIPPITGLTEEEKTIVIDESEKEEGIQEITGGAVVEKGKIKPAMAFAVMLGIITLGSLAYFLLLRKR